MQAEGKIDRGYHNLSKTISLWPFFWLNSKWTRPVVSLCEHLVIYWSSPVSHNLLYYFTRVMGLINSLQGWVLTGRSEMGLRWVRLAPSWTNLGLFKISFQQNVLKTDLKKVPDLSHLGPILTYFFIAITSLPLVQLIWFCLVLDYLCEKWDIDSGFDKLVAFHFTFCNPSFLH